MSIDLAALKARMLAKAQEAQSPVTSSEALSESESESASNPPSSSEQAESKLPVPSSQQVTDIPAGSFYSAQTAMDIAAKLYADASTAAGKNLPASDDDFLAQLDAQKLHEKIEQLRTLLTQEHPGYASLLKDIHSTLSKQPDNVTLLKDEEIGVIVSAAVREAGLQVSAKAASKKTSTKSLKGLTLEDLGF